MQENHSIGEVEQFYFPQSRLGRLEMQGKRMDAPKGFVLARAGEAPEHCYYIRQGRVVSYEYTASGEEHIFSVSEAGSMILVPSMVITHALTLNFKAALPSQLISIDRAALRRILSDDAELTADFLYMLSARLISTIEQFRERGSYSVPWRVCQLLLSMAERDGTAQGGKRILRERISQQEMANRLQANRVTVARAIRELKDLGLLEYSGGLYCVTDAGRMRAYMEDLEAAPN